MPSTPPNPTLWTPSTERVASSELSRFAELVKIRTGFSGSYQELHRWSVKNPAEFWGAIWDYFKPLHTSPYHTVMEQPDSKTIFDTCWFIGAELNFSENLLRHRGEKSALIARNELGQRTVLSYDELHRQVAKIANYLRAQGVKKGDRVAAYVPNIPGAVVAMLATTSLGAIWSSCSPDFGVQGILDRFSQIEPTVLVTHDGYSYAGKQFDSLERSRAILDKLPSVMAVLVIPYLAPDPDISKVRSATLFSDVVNESQTPQLSFLPLPFDHPTYILYSSGTTGVPKCIVHGAGGTLLQLLKELALQSDLHKDDTLLYSTTTGWMMWNWMVSALAIGSTVVLYEGAPLFPNANSLLKIVEEERVTHFGTSARYLAAIEKAGIKKSDELSLRSLRTILSTGSPLAPHSFDYVYRELSADVALTSISGGTDIISCFVLGSPWLPVKRGEIQARGLGMGVEIYDEFGKSIVDSPGELICSVPFPSRPIYFWNDPDKTRYKESYFETFPGVWRHGDWATITADGGVVIYGRSDATLNPGGVRIGTAELYRQIEQLDQVLESLVIGQPWNGDERIILFIKLRADLLLTEDLKKHICKTIRTNCSPRHVPAKIVAVPDIPRTTSGKIVELAVRDTILGRPVKNLSALANPEALVYFQNLTELEE